MRVFLALLACAGVILGWAILSLTVGWERGGGYIGMICMWIAVVTVWCAVTGPKGSRSKKQAIRRSPRRSPAEGVPGPDTPLATFAIRRKGGMFGTKYRLTIRENTLCFLNLKTKESLILDPANGEFGLELHSPLRTYDHIILMDAVGGRLVFRADGKTVKSLKSWKRRRMQ